MTENLTLISHQLCPYVQRAVISLTEKEVPFDRVDIDLANKPDWFLELSPLGKTPVLKVGSRAIFESAVILEFLEETQPQPLHPEDPLDRSEHRSWIEFGSAVLADISKLYGANTKEQFEGAKEALTSKFNRLEQRLNPIGPYFDGSRFTLVDAAFGPVFRYFDAFDSIADLGILSGRPRVADWRRALASRSSVVDAVAPDYPKKLDIFLRNRRSFLSDLMGAGN